MADTSPTLAELGLVTATDPGDESVAETLRSSLGDAGGTGSVLEGSTDAEPAEPGAPVGSVQADTPINGSQPRDEQGRFAAKAEQEAAQAAASTQEAGKAADEPAPLEPPAAWSVKEQEAFRAMPRETQQFVLDRANAAAPKFADVETLLAPRVEELQRLGMTPATYIQHLFQLSDFAGNKPADFIRWFMQQRGVTPEMLGIARAAAQQQTEQSDEVAELIKSDPVAMRLTQQIQALTKQIEGLGGTVTQRAQAEDARFRSSIDGELQQFRDARDKDGNALHPYFDEVRSLMGVFMDPENPEGVSDLQSAYDMAVNAKPSTREKIAAAEQARLRRETQRQEQERAANARKAGSSVVGSPSTSAAQPGPTGDLRADLATEFRKRGMLGETTVI